MQKSMQPLNTSKVLADIQKSMQPFKGVSPAAALPDVQPFKASDVLADIQKAMQTPAFKQTLDHSLGKAGMPDLSTGIVETLRKSRVDLASLSVRADLAYARGVQAEAGVEDEDAPSILGDWIAWLSDDRRRRLSLLSLAALTEALAFAYAATGDPWPAHLEHLILFLLAMAELLSEYQFGEDDPDQQPQDPAPEDGAEAS